MSQKTTLVEILQRYEGVDPEMVNLPPEYAGVIIGGDEDPVDPRTLANWRSTGRHDLKFMKVGSVIRYPLSELLAFRKRHIIGYVGEAA